METLTDNKHEVKHEGKQIKLCVKTISQPSAVHPFKTTDRGKDVVAWGVKHFRLNPTPPRAYTLTVEGSGTELRLDLTIDELGLDGTKCVVIGTPQNTDG